MAFRPWRTLRLCSQCSWQSRNVPENAEFYDNRESDEDNTSVGSADGSNEERDEEDAVDEVIKEINLPVDANVPGDDSIAKNWIVDVISKVIVWKFSSKMIRKSYTVNR